jgi:hypothetical protein
MCKRNHELNQQAMKLMAKQAAKEENKEEPKGDAVTTDGAKVTKGNPE